MKGPAAARSPSGGLVAQGSQQAPLPPGSSRGCRDLLWRIYEKFSNDRILSVAAGVTFYALLAVFPAIAAML
jgi:membrane protein